MLLPENGMEEQIRIILFDEGGMYSVYTGWCNTTIMNGLLYLAELMQG